MSGTCFRTGTSDSEGVHCDDVFEVIIGHNNAGDHSMQAVCASLGLGFYSKTTLSPKLTDWWWHM